MTGTLFFVPSADFLDDPPDSPAIAAATRGRDEVRVDAATCTFAELNRPFAKDLGIGDLKGSDA